MADSNFRGPVVSMGAMEDTSIAYTDGPAISYQGYSVFDGRFAPYNKDGAAPNRAAGFFSSAFFITTDNIPSITSTTTVAAAQSAATTGFQIALNTTSAGGASAGVPSFTVGVPLVPLGTTVATSVAAIDFGFTTGTTVAASSTVVVVDSSLFQPGQWVVIGGAGNTALTTSIITQVQTITNATTIKVAPPAVGALSHAPIGRTNLHAATFGLFPPTTQFIPVPIPNGVSAFQSAGDAVLFDPVQGVTRNITVSGNTTNATAVFLVTGFDMFGALMAEQLTAIGTTAIAGKKAFKYLLAVQVTATSSTGTYSFGLGDVFGINMRAARFEPISVSWNGKGLSSNAGFTAALALTSGPANNTSNDVRGTLAVQNFTAFNAGTSNGTGRLYIGVDLPLMDMLNATTGTTGCVSMFGLAQPTS